MTITDQRPTAPHHHHVELPKPWSRLDGRAAAGLALGVAGLFLFNIICGPYAIALGVAGLRRATSHQGRVAAVASILLGVADLVVLAVLAVSRIHHGGFTWYLN